MNFMGLEPVIIAALVGTGLVAGLAGGLLGIGGGIVIVPVLYSLAPAIGWPAEHAMHLAVGTSLATIIATSLASARGHARRSAVDSALLWTWGPPLAAGVALASALAGPIKSSVLSGFFGAVALAVSANMFRPLLSQGSRDLPAKTAQRAIALAIGVGSTLMGIGGGTLSVPVLTAFGVPIHRAVGTAAAFGIAIAVVGTAGFMVSGWAVAAKPTGAIGFVHVPAALLIVPGTLSAVTWGVKLAHHLNPATLRRLFAAFLGLVALRMIVGAF